MSEPLTTEPGRVQVTFDGSPLPPVGWDQKTSSHVVKVTEHWIVSVAPLMFNDRILLTGHDEWPMCWTAGWCYDKGVLAHLAALAWDPETEREPVGFKKVAADGRKPPRVPDAPLLP